MGGEQLVAHLAAGVSHIEDFAQGVEVAERLAHLAAVDDEVAAVHPIFGIGLAGGGLGLGDFVFVVREDVVHPAGVEVEAFAEQLHAHGGTFDVPARTSPAPRRIPDHIAVFGYVGFPEGEVGGVVFVVFILIDARAGLHALAVEPGEFSIGWKLVDGIVDGAVVGLVGVALLEKRFDEGDHFGDVVGGGGIVLGRFDVELGEVVEKSVDIFFGVFPERQALLDGGADGFVVDIGEVLHLGDPEPAELDVAAEEILEHVGTEVADVGIVVDGGAAGVHAHMLSVERDELLLGAGHGVVYPEGHGYAFSSSTAGASFQSCSRS